MIALCHDRRFAFHYRWSVGLFLLVGMTGCGQKSSTDYVPETNQARQAIERMLEAWRAGEVQATTFSLSDGGPSVQIFDKQRAAGKKLASSEVIKELPSEPGSPRQFAVKLQFDGDKEPVEATYFVVGIDPLLVFRDSEYEQASGMN